MRVKTNRTPFLHVNHRRLCRVKNMLAMCLKYHKAGLTPTISVDKTRERPKGGRCHVTYFPFCYHVAIHSQQNRRIICLYRGVDGRPKGGRCHVTYFPFLKNLSKKYKFEIFHDISANKHVS
jgi:hypothetical protein